jgi:hypothetical protein
MNNQEFRAAFSRIDGSHCRHHVARERVTVAHRRGYGDRVRGQAAHRPLGLRREDARPAGLMILHLFPEL